MSTEEQILAAVAEFRLYWNNISNIETSEFKGDWNDVLLLGYGVYEGFGAAPNSDDHYLESSVFALCLIRQVGFRVEAVCREKNQMVLVPSAPCSGYSINIMPRVQDALARAYPQFDKYENLMTEVLSELLCGTTDPSPYHAVIQKMELAQEIKDRCQRTLRLLDEKEGEA